MREIVFDTETTGLSPAEGDRIVEIGGVELVNHIPTGRVFHVYLNPERPVSPDALRVHGLTDAFLSQKPRFADVAGELIEFLGDARLVAHNATFDMAFLNSELARIPHPEISADRVVDTLVLARRRHVAGSNSLDALCQRYGIDLSQRSLHGALLDAHLLAEVYIELIGGKQAALGLGGDAVVEAGVAIVAAAAAAARPETRAFRVSEEERAAHERLVGTLGEKAIWGKYAGNGQ